MTSSHLSPSSPDSSNEAVGAIGVRLAEIAASKGGSVSTFGAGDLVHLHCTDAHGEWMIRSDADTGRLAITNEHGKGTIAIRGTASDLLALVQGSVSLASSGDRFEVFGSMDLGQLFSKAASE